MIVAYALPVREDAISFIYRKAKISSELEIWNEAMLEEINSLQKNDSWELSELPKGRKIIGCKSVYAKKQRSQDGATVCYKAGLVAKDYAQREYWLQRGFLTRCKTLFHSNDVSIGGIIWIGAGSTRCENRLSSWWSWWGDLYDLAGEI